MHIKKIEELAKSLGLSKEEYSPYGWYIGKVDWRLIDNLKDRDRGKLILVTSINPTPKGEGKTTTTIGLGDAFSRLGKKVIICLREPSLGPVFGVKGGAVGGGKAKVFPDVDINLHFTGDIHAVSSAHNLLSAVIDNHIYQGNELDIDPLQIYWKRCIDMNDRQLRLIISGLGGKGNGIPREDGFEITAASEVMAILAMAKSLTDLKERLGNIVIGVNRKGNPILSKDLKIEGAMTALLKNAFSPNLVQTLEGTPAFIHCGPFGNIAHGCNSVIATQIASLLADYVITEAGFGVDLGGEKFFDIKCRIGNLHPDSAVLVTSIRSLKYHGLGNQKGIEQENLDAIEKGMPNLLHHLNVLRDIFKVPVVVAINRFPTDTENEIRLLEDRLKDVNVRFAVSNVYEAGGEGALELAREVIDSIYNDPNSFRYLYSLEESYEEKIEKISRLVYGAEGVRFSDEAKTDLDKIYKWRFINLPVCIAKTQYSLTDDPKKLGKPTSFYINVQKLKISLGAGFVVAYTGNILTMPGLPKLPSAVKIDVDDNGEIVGIT
ncbi:MAG: formate--tetrahydrofolate ligase [bacterium]|nr:formate--tetrahydrofolate ligase [bacterium]